jgi:hypothetical protein
MAIERIKVNNYNALGNEFIEWALDDTKAPTNLAGFIEKVVDTGIIDPLPNYITSFQKAPRNKKEVLLLRLPPAELVQDTLDSIKNKEDYFLPPFYEVRLKGPNPPNDRDFFGFRVGDYVIAHCS